MPDLGPWPPLLGGLSAVIWLVRLIIGYQHTIGERYGREIDRLDRELVAARETMAEQRGQLAALESGQAELRWLRRAADQAGIFNPWAPNDPPRGIGEARGDPHGR